MNKEKDESLKNALEAGKKAGVSKPVLAMFEQVFKNIKTIELNKAIVTLNKKIIEAILGTFPLKTQQKLLEDFKSINKKEVKNGQ